MKSYQEFLESKKQPLTEQKEVVVSDNLEFLETKDYDENLGESTVRPDPMDPPAVLIMRRKSIRQFPNGQRVALYYVDKINKYVTVPYVAMQWSSMAPVEEQTEVIEQIKNIAKNNINGIITHNDGSKSNLCVEQAKMMLEVFKKLTSENKNIFKNMISESKNNFQQATKFVEKS